MKQEDQVKHTTHGIVDQNGNLDILINNAGIGIASKTTETPEEDWDKVMNVKVKGIFFTCKYTIPVMLANKGGTIVNMASAAGVVTSARSGATEDATLADLAVGPNQNRILGAFLPPVQIQSAAAD